MDLVIPDEDDMNKFLMVVIKAMNTVDGNRDSLRAVEDKILETKRQNGHLLSYKDYDDDRKL